MARIRDWPALIFLASAFAVIGNLILLTSDHFLVQPARFLGETIAGLFQPDAGQSLTLDHATRAEVAAIPDVASRFVNFIKRSLLHDEFTADHYDPGWRTA